MTSANRSRKNVHPFPARMAPEIALAKIDILTQSGGVVLDPMCGSGTVPRIALQSGRQAIGCDMDPLAVIMSRTACSPSLSKNLTKRAMKLVDEARKLSDELPPWIAADPKSVDFVSYWFASEQRKDLSKLARILSLRPAGDDPLRVALSRMIVTKDGGASLARDTSHSRPHRVRLINDFDVFEGFLAAASRVQSLVESAPASSTSSRASIRGVDARKLGFVPRDSVDLTVTSPPYLNAIDYLRGHRLSLIWLGWTMSELRRLRSETIGAERALPSNSEALQKLAQSVVPGIDGLSRRDQNMTLRYARDVDRLCRSIARVTKPGGYLVFVVADSQLRGVPILNSHFCKVAALRHGFKFIEGVTRSLPTQHRYLPPPEVSDGSFGSRMREEAVLTFAKA